MCHKNEFYLSLLFTFSFAVMLSAFGQVKTEDEEGWCINIQSPTIPGGPDPLKSFIKKNLKRPTTMEISGKVFIEAIVNEDGSITNFILLKKLCEECDRNALEVLTKMPKWTFQ